MLRLLLIDCLYLLVLFNCVLAGAMTCADAVCQHSATCTNVTGGGVKCKCSTGYAGKYCERTYISTV